MSERGIIMQAESVRAILAGRKSQTRRVVMPQPGAVLPPIRVEEYEPVRVARSGEEYAGEPIFGAYSADGEWGVRCPYGAPGDRLYVKEGWSACDYDTAFAPRYRADGVAPHATGWRSPLHMPRWASRITLEITKVRVQRVQDISGEDALAEGCPGDDHGLRTDRPRGDLAVAEYAACWDALNAKRGFPWSSNPWVWAVTFKRVGGIRA